MFFSHFICMSGCRCKDAGIYARGLADNCLKGVMEGGEEDPLRLMEKAHKQTLAPGASTACIVQIEHSTSTARIVRPLNNPPLGSESTPLGPESTP